MCKSCYVCDATAELRPVFIDGVGETVVCGTCFDPAVMQPVENKKTG